MKVKMRPICKKTSGITFLRSLFAITLVFVGLVQFSFAQEGRLEKANRLYSEATSLIAEQTFAGFTKALENYREAAKLYTLEGEKTGLAKSYVGQGFVNDALGRPQEALVVYDKAFKLFDELKNDYWAARTLNNMGRIYDDTGDPQKALEFFGRAIPLRMSAKDSNGEAVTRNSVGAVYAKLGEFKKALEYYSAAWSIRNSPFAENDNNNQRSKAIILNNIGRVYDELGNYEEALNYLNRALELRRATNDRSGEAITLNNLGLISAAMGKNNEALEFYSKALAILEDLGQPYRAAEVWSNTGVVNLNQNNTDEALLNFKTALKYHQQNGEKGGAATALNNIAVAEQRKGIETAPATLNEALLLSRQSGEASLEAMTLNNLMWIWKERSNLSVAAFYGKQSVNKYQALRSSIRTLNDDVKRNYLASITSTYRDLADILIELGQFSQAKQVLNILKAEEYFDFVRRDASEIKNLKTTVTLTEQENELLKRYSEIAERVTELSREFAELDTLKRRSLRDGKEPEKKDSERYAELSKQLGDANNAFRLFIEKQLLDELGIKRVREIEYDRNLQAKLRRWGKGTVAVYTVVTDNRYRVILTTPTVQVDGKTEIKASDLNKKIYEFRNALQDISTDPRTLGKELYDILLKPIEKALKAADAKTLVWSLDGTLRYIPVAALSPDGDKYLVETMQNAIVTAKTRDDLDDSDVEWKALGLGVSKAVTIENPADSDEVFEFNAIPGSVRELNSIVRDERTPTESGLFDGRRFLDEDFTIGAFENALATETANGRPKYSVIHLASHFRLGSNWNDSFLLLGNGKYLTLEQISNSPTLNFGDVELVTLSACDTAFANDSNGKEIDSLAEAIQTKSGKSVLATLWAVVDESTPLLMTEFYRFRKNDPTITKAEAMQNVQSGFVSGRLKPDAAYIERLAGAMAVRGASPSGKPFSFDKSKPFAHPYFWSPFVLIGNWR